jgi:hypothetical protein
MLGVDDEVGALGSIVFEVWTDGVKRYDSGVVTGATAARSVSVNLAGASQLTLIVTDGGDNANYDHGDWADAQVACSDTIPRAAALVSPAPGTTDSADGAKVAGSFGGATTAAASTATIRLTQGATPMAADVTDAAATHTGTRNATAPLTARTTGTPTMAEGSSRVKGVAGGALRSTEPGQFTTH